MSERIEQFTDRPHANVRYPWSEWTDGSIWRIKRGEDFNSATTTMRHYLYNQAQRRQSTVVTSLLDEDTLEFQFKASS